MKTRQSPICGLDIGMSKVCATCANFGPGGEVDVLAAQVVPVAGIKWGAAADNQSLIRAIKEAVKGVRQNCGLKVSRVWVNIDSPDLEAKDCVERIAFARNLKIDKSQLEKLIDACVSTHLPLNRKAVYLAIKKVMLDGQLSPTLSSYAAKLLKRRGSLKNVYPEGCAASSLELNALALTSPVSVIDNLLNCVKEAGLIVEGAVPSSLAQAACLLRNNGQNSTQEATLVDVGYGLTKIAVFAEGLIKSLVILPLGSQSITEALADSFRISLDCAEQLKLKYGLVSNETRTMNQRLIVKDRTANKIVSLNELDKIIKLKVDFLLEQIRLAWPRSNDGPQKSGAAIITGGGSMLEGFLERAEQALGRTLKLGFLSAVKESAIQTRSALYSTSVGLSCFGFNNRDNRKFYEEQRFSSFKRVLTKTQNIYREYF